MRKIKDFFKSFVSVVIVMLGVYLTSFYLGNEFSLTSVGSGIVGLLILYPAVKKWDTTLWGKKNEEL
jgi:L-lactate permease